MQVWPNQKFGTLFSVWKFLLLVLSASKLPKSKNRPRNNPNSLQPLLEQLINMVTKLSQGKDSFFQKYFFWLLTKIWVSSWKESTIIALICYKTLSIGPISGQKLRLFCAQSQIIINSLTILLEWNWARFCLCSKTALFKKY